MYMYMYMYLTPPPQKNKELRVPTLEGEHSISRGDSEDASTDVVTGLAVVAPFSSAGDGQESELAGVDSAPLQAGRSDGHTRGAVREGRCLRRAEPLNGHRTGACDTAVELHVKASDALGALRVLNDGNRICSVSVRETQSGRVRTEHKIG